MTHRITWNEVRRSASAFPITTIYGVGVFIFVLMQRGEIGLATGITSLSIIALLAMNVSISRELRVVHILVNSQHEALVARVNQLLDALDKADAKVPDVPEERN